jgi:hypothetical protein
MADANGRGILIKPVLSGDPGVPGDNPDKGLPASLERVGDAIDMVTAVLSKVDMEEARICKDDDEVNR